MPGDGPAAVRMYGGPPGGGPGGSVTVAAPRGPVGISAPAPRSRTASCTAVGRAPGSLARQASTIAAIRGGTPRRSGGIVMIR